MTSNAATSDVDVATERRQRNGRRPRRPSLNGDEFLERTLELFLEEGYEGTSIDRITSEIGIAKRSVYLRFGDKKSLFLAALEKAIDDWIIPIEVLREAETDDLEQSLLAVGRLLVENVLRPAGIRLLQLTNEVARKMPEIASFSVHYGTDPTLDYLEDLFSRHRGSAGSRDAAEAYLHLVVGGPASAVSSGLVSDQAAIDARIAFSVHIFLHGLVPQAASPSAVDDQAALRGERARLRGMLHELADRVGQTIADIDALP